MSAERDVLRAAAKLLMTEIAEDVAIANSVDGKSSPGNAARKAELVELVRNNAQALAAIEQFEVQVEIAQRLASIDGELENIRQAIDVK